MKSSAILIHGYGVRGFFWSALKEELQGSFQSVLAPDFEVERVEAGVSAIVELVREERKRNGEPAVLIGHSLGGVLAALACRELSLKEATHLVLVAAPYGEIPSGGISTLLRFAVRFKLIPEWVIRPRFFGSEVPKEKQKELFSRAVPESRALQDLSRQKRWFHTGTFSELPEQRVLAIASAADRIVDPRETIAFGEELQGETLLLPEEAGVGHDDFGFWPPAAKRVAEAVARFAKE
jgi:pimeloyl-ACP methyl ester carboxylesterase